MFGWVKKEFYLELVPVLFSDVFFEGRIYFLTRSRTKKYNRYLPSRISVISIVSKVKLATVVEGHLKAPFSIATRPRCKGECNSFPRITPLYP